MFNEIMPVLRVADIEGSMDWYTRIGFHAGVRQKMLAARTVGSRKEIRT